MFDKNLLLDTIDSALSARKSLHAELQELNAYSESEDRRFCDRTDMIVNMRKDISENDYVSRSDYMRLAADFDNFKKRTARDKVDVMNQANRDIISDLLTVIDDMERLIGSFPKKGLESDVSRHEAGFNMIYENLVKILHEEGCFEIDVHEGDAFNPNMHEAMLSRDASESGYGTDRIISVLQTGWTLNGRLLRAAKVVVSK